MVDLITEKIGAVNSFVIPQRAENQTPKFQGDKNNSFEEKAKKISTYYIHLYSASFPFLFIINLQTMGSLWCGVMTGFRSI